MTTTIGRRHWWALGALVALALLYGHAMTSCDAYRAKLDWEPVRYCNAYRIALLGAGDTLLPGRNSDAASVLKLAQTFADPARNSMYHTAYVDFLRLDAVLVLLILAALLFLAFMLRRENLQAWSRRLAIAAIIYAAADWTENILLWKLFSEPVAGLERWALSASAVKWLALILALGLAALGAARLRGSGSSWWLALFRDVPFIIDGAWRRAEFIANREYGYVPAQGGNAAHIEERTWWKKPPFGYFLLTLIFITCGPTLDVLCSIAPQPVPRILPYMSGIALLLSIVPAYLALSDSIRRRVHNRFTWLDPADVTLQQPPAQLEERTRVATTILWTAALVFLASMVATMIVLLHNPVLNNDDACRESHFSWWTPFAVLVCIGAVAAYRIALRRAARTSTLIWLQSAIAVGVCGLVLCLFPTQGHVEAESVPYRHVFGFLAPTLLLALALAPLFACLAMRPSARGAKRWRIDGIDPATRDFFRAQLTRTELFVTRDFPPAPHGSHVTFALIRALSYRGVALLLPPAMLALVAPAHWLWTFTLFGLAISLFLSTWGTMSLRWGEMNRHIDRWFLSGTPLFISIFLIVIASLRVAGIDYVTTIVDAAPFGVLFATVVMSYALSWLVEYWINRMLAVELLAVLGAGSESTAAPYAVATPGAAIRVAREGRFIAYHGLGRFVVMGTLTPHHMPTGNAPAADTAFHSYDLLDLFSTLAGPHADELGRVMRYSNLYFYALNVVILFVFAGFLTAHLVMTRGLEKPVLTLSAKAPGTGLKDIAHDLLVKDTDRPAVVVVASGGGTRAALYTSHVLQGLKQVGVAEDIVLASGVSGGGVALAYFTLNYGDLAGTGSNAGAWETFRARAAEDLITDVLEGAQEWRIFGTTPLTALLAESMERNLFASRKPTLALGNAPALILNTTITGHPAEDSEVLMKTLGTPPSDCREAERPYNMMNGGRLVFTNLKNKRAFPVERLGSGTPGDPSAAQTPPIPNTRLPYWVVQEPSVSLAYAAALNANFPPVFPNARVQIKDYAGPGCGDRSYLVTDGGAEENLGLVSGLYAVQSALRDLQDDCKTRAKCGRLRPIHFVIAEASGAGYDYSQDRGVSAITGGSRERLTGGLTNALIDETRALYRALGGDASRIVFHYLPLPLAFRARGGFGTHWMQAAAFDLRDPRDRSVPWNPFSQNPLSKTTISREEIDLVWLALHQRSSNYCGIWMQDGTIATDRVQRWICGGAPDDVNAQVRDLHIDAWNDLVKALRR